MAKITTVTCAGLRGFTPEGGWSNEIRPEDCIQTLIRVETDAGLTGYGSVFNYDGLVQGALDVLEPLFCGENALEPERVSEKLRQNMFWLGRGGAITHTISGIEIALWDILGKATGQPIGRLLGGRYREKVRPYCSILMDEPEALAEELMKHLEHGFKAFKIGWGPFGRNSKETDRKIVAAAREAVGPDALLMVDAGGSDAFWNQGYKWALNTARMLSEYEVTWFEEPLDPDNKRDYILLRRQSPVPISGGEVLTRRQSFWEWITEGALDIVQPDVTKVGGITESRRIAWTAQEYGVKFIPHGWNTAVGLATDLQLASAFPYTDFVEYIGGSPYVDSLTVTGWSLDSEGYLSIPDGPGLGIELDIEQVAKYTDGKMS
jgi:L-alanine-DL-glutamate epimerase-like enolase superfamily enzyme